MFVPVIGLEIHIQLKTRTKMFCSCPTTEQNVRPNTNVCPICMGHPGTLPVPNEEAIRQGIRMGLALRGTIAEHSKFDRKHYFYPDLPKGYQISQYDLPIVANGYLDIEIPEGSDRTTARIGITRAHLEEDAAKSFHDSTGKTYVDYNRGGVPLLETVTEPDFRSPAEAKAFLQELRLIARTLGVSEADMEKGHLRCDANISLRQIDEKGEIVGAKFNPKTEIKNLNSFRHVERALQYEIKRQTKLWEEGTPPMVSTTRGWNDAKQVTEEQRTKEGAEDYRYFPEPDIPVLQVGEWAKELISTLPELPSKRRERFVTEFGLKKEDARRLVDDGALADFTEAVFSELGSWMTITDDQKPLIAKLVSGWLLNKLTGLLTEHNQTIEAMKVDAENMAEFISLLATNKLAAASAMTVLTEMVTTGADPSHVMEDKGLGRTDDAGALLEIIQTVLKQNPDAVLRYKAGKKELFQFFVGMVMKATEGNADAGVTKNLLLTELEK